MPINTTIGETYSMTAAGDSGTYGYLLEWYEDTGNGYANGRNDQASNHDYCFITYYTTGRGALGISAGTTSKIMGFAASATELQLNYQIT